LRISTCCDGICAQLYVLGCGLLGLAKDTMYMYICVYSYAHLNVYINIYIYVYIYIYTIYIYIHIFSKVSSAVIFRRKIINKTKIENLDACDSSDW